MSRIRPIVVLAALLALAGASTPPAHAAYRGANGLIAFVRPSSADSSVGDIWTVRPNGTSPRRLTFTGDNSWPSWSPNGTQIAFTSSRAGSDDIWVMNADGTGLRRVTAAASAERYPTWSPDGRWLAFSSDRPTTDPENPRAFLYKLRSTRPYGTAIRLTWSGVNDVGGYDYDWRPSWSTLGTIYFTREFRWPGDYEPPWSSIFSVPGAGGAQTDVLPAGLGGSGWSGDVSPDGGQLVWSADQGSDGYYDPPLEIMIRDASGTIRELTPERQLFTTQNPAWSPDGTRIAYDRVTVDTGAAQIMTIRPDGTQGTTVVANGVSPSWQPLPR